MSRKSIRKVTIFEPSLEYLDIDTKYGYKRVFDKIQIVKGRCVIHIFPTRDTYRSDNKNDLDGYCDSIMFSAKIYDNEKKIVYKSSKLFDNIDIRDLNVNSRVCKDLSTMYIFENPVKINYGNFYNTLDIRRLK